MLIKYLRSPPKKRKKTMPEVKPTKGSVRQIFVILCLCSLDVSFILLHDFQLNFHLNRRIFLWWRDEEYTTHSKLIQFDMFAWWHFVWFDVPIRTENSILQMETWQSFASFRNKELCWCLLVLLYSSTSAELYSGGKSIKNSTFCFYPKMNHWGLQYTTHALAFGLIIILENASQSISQSQWVLLWQIISNANANNIITKHFPMHGSFRYRFFIFFLGEGFFFISHSVRMSEMVPWPSTGIQTHSTIIVYNYYSVHFDFFFKNVLRVNDPTVYDKKCTGVPKLHWLAYGKKELTYKKPIRKSFDRIL